ncbi:RNA polymerase sigma factor [Dyadobacter aurulentus]|uniref:RNA polymerase sigma factor n=1 Tax=Dyadobacter sp. UC 10 TaxID=2605428 RepID=UPI001788B787|nr:sigma-70 family RNA polymerase sigma factor [Dyadobacter sp. UC 10]
MDEEAKLWRRFLEGDRTVFDFLVQTYYTSLFDYSLKFTSDRNKAKDHVHDLFTTLWERRAHLSPVDHIKPYLLKSIRNNIFKEFNRSGVFQNISDYEDEIVQDESMEMRMISEESVIERQRKVNFILSQLTRRQREIIHLKFYEGLSNEQIADILFISRGAVANLLHQSLKLVKQKWELLNIALSAFLYFADYEIVISIFRNN